MTSKRNKRNYKEDHDIDNDDVKSSKSTVASKYTQ